MKLGTVMLLCAVTVGGLVPTAAGVTADSAGNPYQVIVDRNPFGLKLPTPVDQLPKPPGPPPPTVELSGISTFGKKQAFLQVQEPARPPEPARKVYLTLTEGERQGQIEVLQIDLALGIVKISNSGVITNLDLKNNAPKLAGGPPVMPAAPTAAGVPRVGVPPPSPFPVPSAANPGAVNFGGGMRSIPTTVPSRPIRTSMTGGGGLGVVAGVPGAGVTVGAGSPVGTQTPIQQPLTAEESYILTELERERTKEIVKKGLMPPLPPTPLTPASERAPQVPPPPPQ